MPRVEQQPCVHELTRPQQMLLVGKLGSQPDRISGPDNLVIDEVECALIELLAVLTIDEEVTSPRDMRSWTRTKFASGSVKIVIDPRPYQAELDQAIANRDRDQAHLKNAEIDYNRYTGLAKQKSIAQQLADSQKAIVDQLVAIIKSDEAIIESARVNLGYTNLTSPIDGVTGIRQMDIGNIIHPTDVNGLVDVTQIEPISRVGELCRN